MNFIYKIAREGFVGYIKQTRLAIASLVLLSVMCYYFTITLLALLP